MEDSVYFKDENDNLILNTYSDYKILISDINISEAEIKEEIVELPGSSKILDFTESLLGDVAYNRRLITIELNGRKNNEEYLQIHSEIQNLIHGKLLKIFFSREPNFYWLGRVSIKDINPLNIIRVLTIEAIVNPYKYDLQTSLEDWLWDPFSFVDGIINECKELKVSGELNYTIYGRRMHVIPIIKCSENMQVEFKNIIYDLIPGTNEVLDIEIVEGKNALKFIGRGEVSIEYRGGSL